jgi:hypothetical protein
MSTPSAYESLKRIYCRANPDIDDCRLQIAHALELSRAKSNYDAVIDYLLGEDFPFHIGLLLGYIIWAILIAKAVQFLRRFVAHHKVAR